MDRTLPTSIGRGLKIMTVEDAPPIVARLIEMLAGISGVQYMGNATTVAAALELATICDPDAMIVDIHLGAQEKQNGIDLLYALRARHLPVLVIMLTNLADPGYRKLCADGGADFFFDKSHDFDRIPETLLNILDKKSLSESVG